MWNRRPGQLWFHPEVKNDFHARLTVSMSFHEDVDALKPRSNGNLLAGSWQYPWWKDAAVEARVIDGRSFAQHLRQKLAHRDPNDGTSRGAGTADCRTMFHATAAIAWGGFHTTWYARVLQCMEINPSCWTQCLEHGLDSTFVHPSDLLAPGWEDPPWCEGRGSWLAENRCWASHFGRSCITYY